jgi:hypothetical protein
MTFFSKVCFGGPSQQLVEPESIWFRSQHHSAESECASHVLLHQHWVEMARSGLTLGAVPAQVFVPAASVEDVTEGGLPLTQVSLQSFVATCSLMRDATYRFKA